MRSSLSDFRNSDRLDCLFSTAHGNGLAWIPVSQRPSIQNRVLQFQYSFLERTFIFQHRRPFCRGICDPYDVAILWKSFHNICFWRHDLPDAKSLVFFEYFLFLDRQLLVLIHHLRNRHTSRYSRKQAAHSDLGPARRRCVLSFNFFRIQRLFTRFRYCPYSGILWFSYPPGTNVIVLCNHMLSAMLA